MKKAAISAVCLAFGLLGASTGADADILNLDTSSSGGITFTETTGSGGPLEVSITSMTGIATLNPSGDTGSPPSEGYTLGALTTVTTGAENAHAQFVFPAGTTESLGVKLPGGTLTGTVTWTLIQDGGTNPQFIGTFTGTGTGDMAGTYTDIHIDLTTNSLSTILDQFAQGQTQTVGASSGEVEGVGVPGPVIGAGLPGIVVACLGLLALARRRRRALA